MWDEEKIYFLYVLLNFMFVGIYSYCVIQVPKIVLRMIESTQVDIAQLFILFVAILFAGLGASFCKYKYTPIGYELRYKKLLELNDKIFHLPLSELEKPEIRDNLWTISRPVSSVDGIQWFFLHFAELSSSLSIIFVSVGILFQLHVLLSIFIIVWFFVYVYMNISVNEKIDTLYEESSREFRHFQYYSDVAMDVAFGKELRVFSLKSWFSNKLHKMIHTLENIMSKITNLASAPLLCDGVYQFIRDAFMYISLLQLYFDGQIDIASFSTYSVLVMQLNSALDKGMNNFEKMCRRYTQYNDLFAMLGMEDVDEKGMSVTLASDWEIEFKNISFHYPGSTNYIYKNLNFKIKNGKKLAIIGLNGVGKSTFVNLLMRLYEPIEGEILLNGINIQSYKLSEYFDLFAPVFQEINLYPYSIKDNLTFGKDITEEEIDDVFKKVGLGEKMKDISYEQELTKYLSEDGMNLSGGEAQKFAIARALCSKRPILILDEPTSALDAIAEYDFYHKINHEYKVHTILFVSHRLASTSFCDEIILIDNRNISEYGTHDELMKKQGSYYNLFQVQSKHYQEEVSI
ncbi:ABC transporter ATP-binding protein [Breznakia pachnodae]|uniref:ATP-binding cassette subfamily C protein n=1 Tax=Breznakia pachnodae TaxID=265178 RepID=A0ABU0E4A1_9FIRM|nr:ABC transporter ATP-binding protein [Breznakia pachnodae]MDQ0361523.1 ATP-binding cassette subfamily C protein [Breznakia pachnodae]